jgi:hypothetical protein
MAVLTDTAGREGRQLAMLLHSLWVQPGMLFAGRSLISERVRKIATMEARKHWASRGKSREGLALEEIAEDVTVGEVVNATQAPLRVRSSIMPSWMPLVSSSTQGTRADVCCMLLKQSIDNGIIVSGVPSCCVPRFRSQRNSRPG